MCYIVPPGLYAIGTPSTDSPVLVTANYKISYDLVRQQLTGRNIWLLVLETFGVNVWCAAGKETFGTDELVSRINRTDLHNVVNHRRLILPILGAPGVSAHKVTKRTGFTINYATIRASDLPEYLDNGMTTKPAMRELTFSTYERLVLVPVEIVLTMKSIATFGSVIFVAAWLANSPTDALMAFLAYLGAVLTGVALVPCLLPWIPGRSFAIKGVLAGLIWSSCLFYLGADSSWNITTIIAAFLALPAISAFYAMNFTGCTTYTSRSGVKKEMRLAIPLIGSALAAAFILLIVGRFI
jgi:acetyl-CoA decarbonylase/synthase complex subunit gamma